VAQFLGKPDMCQVRVRARHECNWLIPGASGLPIPAKDPVRSGEMESSAMVPKDPLTPDKYKERATILQYSLTFSGAAVAFLVTAQTQLHILADPQTMKCPLLLWGVTIFLAFLAYVLSYRAIWSHPTLPRFRKYIVPVELVSLDIVLFFHPLAFIGAIFSTFWVLWRAFA